MKDVANLLFALTLASVLIACGGGGSDAAPTASLPTRDVRPSLAPDVSGLAIASSISTFESPAATAIPGKNIAVIDTKGVAQIRSSQLMQVKRSS